MNRKTKITIGVVAGVALLTTAIIFRKKISRAILGATRFNSKLAKTAIGEWEHWSKGSTKEGASSTMARLRRYWREGAGVDWSDKKMVDEAWSAAYISFLMKESGAGDDFKYSTSHSVYIVDSINNRKKNNKNPFKGFKPEEVKVQKGDLVCYGRQSGVNYDKTGRYKSHCDIVIDVDKGNAKTLGGNISNSVSLTNVPLDSDGKISKSKASKYFVVIKNSK